MHSVVLTIYNASFITSCPGMDSSSEYKRKIVNVLKLTVNVAFYIFGNINWQIILDAF